METRRAQAVSVEQRAILVGGGCWDPHVFGEDFERDRSKGHRLDADEAHLGESGVGSFEIVDQLPTNTEEVHREGLWIHSSILPGRARRGSEK